jgi:hypothetical protein
MKRGARAKSERPHSPSVRCSQSLSENVSDRLFDACRPNT